MRLILSILICLLPVLASTVSAQGNADAGKELYSTCAACHGVDGAGAAAMKAAPRLTQLESTYLVTQLQKFKAGIRGGAGDSKVATQMAAMNGPRLAGADECRMLADHRCGAMVGGPLRRHPTHGGYAPGGGLQQGSGRGQTQRAQKQFDASLRCGLS